MLDVALALALHASLNLVAVASTEGPIARAPVWDGRTRTIHEWGTFTAVQGSDGVVLDGLRHHERDLPRFVYDLAGPGGILALTLKMETPVVYFYAPGTWKLDVDVRFPRGLVTQWWPAAEKVNEPCARDASALAERCARAVDLKDGFVGWGAHDLFTVLPRAARPELPAVAADDPWRFARDVASNALQVGYEEPVPGGDPRWVEQHERFLFYRGLGDFALPLAVRVRSEERGDATHAYALTLANADAEHALRGVFVIDVEGERAGFARLDDLASTREQDVTIAMRPRDESTRALTERVAAELARTGLFADEALAMARTWAHGWFGDEGLRVLYVLPAPLVDRELPLTTARGWFQPEAGGDWIEGASPEAIVRTFVGRTEVLTPSRERAIERTIRASDSGDATAAAEIDRWGRFAEPWLERASRTSRDERVRGRALALLAERKRLPGS